MISTKTSNDKILLNSHSKNAKKGTNLIAAATILLVTLIQIHLTQNPTNTTDLTVKTSESKHLKTIKPIIQQISNVVQRWHRLKKNTGHLFLKK